MMVASEISSLLKVLYRRFTRRLLSRSGYGGGVAQQQGDDQRRDAVSKFDQLFHLSDLLVRVVMLSGRGYCKGRAILEAMRDIYLSLYKTN